MFIALRWMQEPGGVMVWLAENIQACLRDFLAATASMARKRHLASTARGFCCFCLMTLVTTGLIRPIRGEKKNLSSGVMPLTLLNLGCTRHSSSQLGSALICTRFQAAFMVCSLYRGRCPRLLMVVPSRHQSDCGIFFLPRIERIYVMWR